MESLERQAQHHRRVLAGGVEHHRLLELGCHLEVNVDALGFELQEVIQTIGLHSDHSTWSKRKLSIR